MAEKNVHDDLKGVRKPRLHITYDVETGGGLEKKELPFVVGVMGDYSGDNIEGKKPLQDRRFVNIDRDDFDDTVRKVAPSLGFRVENTLAGDGSEIAIDLKFTSMKDFEPEQVVEQVEPLRKLLEVRNTLRDLMSKADRSEELENVLEQFLKSSDELARLSSQLGEKKNMSE